MTNADRPAAGVRALASRWGISRGGRETRRRGVPAPGRRGSVDKSLKLNIASDLVGMPVSSSGSSLVMGDITDALIQPMEGRLLGLALRTHSGTERMVLARRLEVGMKCISIIKDEVASSGRKDGLSGGVRALRELCGANVVTDEGQLLGRVCEIQVSPNDGRVTYGIAEAPLLRRLFGSGFTVEGSVAHSYSRAGSRLIVHAPDTPSEVGGRLHSALGPTVRGWWKVEQSLHAFLYRYGFLIWLAILIGLLMVLLWL